MDTITNSKGQLESCVGKDAVEAFRLRTIIVGVRAESKGMRLTRGISCTKLAKELTGLKTNNREILMERLQAMLNEQISRCLVVENGEQK